MSHIHGGDIEEAKKKYNIKGDMIIDFSVNINFIGPPPDLYNNIVKNITDIERYPEPNSRKLKIKLSEHHGINLENIVLANGAVEIIYQLLDIIKAKNVLIMEPAFSEYEMAVLKSGGSVELLLLKEKNNFKADVDEIIEMMSGVDLIFICNPHNPSGHLLLRPEIEKILKSAESQGVFMVLDEAFIDFVDNLEGTTLINSVDKYKNLFIIRSMTKFYAIPGLRLGYGVGAKELISNIEQGRDPWNVNILAQRAGLEALSSNKYINLSRRKNREERLFLFNELKKITGIIPFKPAANFIFLKISKDDMDVDVLSAKLAEKGILIRDCSSYQGLDKNYFRLAVKSRKENIFLLQNLKNILNTYSYGGN